MTDKRYHELMASDDLKLSQEEIAAGWHFCSEMDGLLANSNEADGDCFCTLNEKRFRPVHKMNSTGKETTSAATPQKD